MRALGTALAVALADPRLWLLGSVGFAARGGILLLALPIWTLPSPVDLTILIGADALTPTGFSSRFLGALAGLLALSLVAGLGLFALAAWSDRASIARQVAEAGPPALEPTLGRILAIVIVQLAALAPIVLALLFAGRSLLDIVRVEVLQPSDLATPLPMRVAMAAWPVLVLLAAALAAAEVVASLATREVVAGRDAPQAIGRALTQAFGSPLVAIGTLLLAWATSLVALGPSAVALMLTGGLVRASYLDPAGPFRPEGLHMTVLATAFLASAFSAAVVLAGFASAVRAHLWTLAWSRAATRPRAVVAFGVPRWASDIWTRRRH